MENFHVEVFGDKENSTLRKRDSCENVVEGRAASAPAAKELR